MANDTSAIALTAAGSDTPAPDPNASPEGFSRFKVATLKLTPMDVFFAMIGLSHTEQSRVTEMVAIHHKLEQEREAENDRRTEWATVQARRADEYERGLKAINTPVHTQQSNPTQGGNIGNGGVFASSQMHPKHNAYKAMREAMQRGQVDVAKRIQDEWMKSTLYAGYNYDHLTQISPVDEQALKEMLGEASGKEK